MFFFIVLKESTSLLTQSNLCIDLVTHKNARRKRVININQKNFFAFFTAKKTYKW